MKQRSFDEKILRDQDASNYDKWYLERGLNAVTSEDMIILDKLNLNLEVNNFLDFGCGTGRFTSKVKEKFPDIECYGLDISPKSIEILKNKNITVSSSVFDASIDTIKDLDFPKFDRILSMQMIQHLTKDGAIHSLNEIYNSLNDDGLAIIELYNYSGLLRILERFKSFGKIKKVQQDNLFFEYRYSANEFREFMLKYTNFHNIKVYGCQNISRRFINKLNWLVDIDINLSNFQLSKYLGYYFIVVLQK